MKSHPRGILERRPGVWYVRYADAKHKMRWKKAGTEATAKILYQKLKAQVLRERLIPELIPKRVPFFNELVEDCLRWSKAHKRSWREDRWRMRRIFERFGKFKADAVTPSEIEALMEKMKADGLSNSSVNRTLALLSLVFRLAINTGKLSDNPLKRVKKLKENPGRTRFLSEEEEERLREEIIKRFPEHLPEVIIAIHTGLRQSEQYGLRWEHVDFERGMITIPRPKNGETRYIPINAAALEAFLEVKQRDGNSETVFGVKSPRMWFEKACREAKLENLRWHDLRHTFGSRLTMKGVPIRAVQELMGHKTLAMTMRYSHLAPDYLKSAIEALTDGPKLYVRKT